jgi:uncharacterized Fe-S cluster protein YjdI
VRLFFTAERISYENLMTDPRNRQYTNGEITVFWIPSKCIHATTCFRELIDVFNPGRRPWVNMEGAPTRRIAEVVNKCPTQALVWKYNKDLTDDEKVAQRQTAVEELNPQTATGNKEQAEKVTPGKPTSIRIMKDGPIVVNGEFKIIGADTSELRKTPMTSFCRCGNSKSMPYCDGTHRKIGFSE